jgi:hypothetical protein
LPKRRPLRLQHLSDTFKSEPRTASRGTVIAAKGTVKAR